MADTLMCYPVKQARTQSQMERYLPEATVSRVLRGR
eukprot:CAMPEP_0113250218 /NCGR_PEP_ID=MMETSP0008_2-20120614/11465_1 /TAXON_ID=97485 /ORGANISM="Prymnesium parvum" /LENGTH=35 /DNA_ID=CAMNT_0000098183 /DNA_START=119 /DNA_END=226 /DNA_ORIENTATION=- /assembly_acc=CAM_ASM_000153